MVRSRTFGSRRSKATSTPDGWMARRCTGIESAAVAPCGGMNPLEVAAILDARAERYGGDDWHRRDAQALVAATPLRSGDCVLDAGTGTGFAACAVARRVGPEGRVLAVDVSAGMLRQARRVVGAEQLTNVEWLEADATDLSELAASSF